VRHQLSARLAHVPQQARSILLHAIRPNGSCFGAALFGPAKRATTQREGRALLSAESQATSDTAASIRCTTSMLSSWNITLSWSSTALCHRLLLIAAVAILGVAADYVHMNANDCKCVIHPRHCATGCKCERWTTLLHACTSHVARHSCSMLARPIDLGAACMCHAMHSMQTHSSEHETCRLVGLSAPQLDLDTRASNESLIAQAMLQTPCTATSTTASASTCLCYSFANMW
jgi:hypothetical protein